MDHVQLPDFSLLARQPKIPHNARTILKRDIPNEYGTPIMFAIKRTRKGDKWFFYASLHGMRMSNTISTTKPDVAANWYLALEAGDVSIEKQL